MATGLLLFNTEAMNVIKIGGSTLRTEHEFYHLAQCLVQDYTPPTTIVISALPMVTRQLEQAAYLAQEHRLHDAQSLLAQIIYTHQQWATKLITDPSTQQVYSMMLEELTQQSYQVLQGIHLTAELTSRTLDRLTSIGERMAMGLIHHYLLECGLTIASLPGTELIVTDSVHGNAQPQLDATRLRVQERLLPLFERFDYVITEGFVGRSTSGEITTMGKESSSLTAALLARILDARQLVLLTPVAGIHSADPAIVPTASPIPILSYRQASSLAHLGLKLLYPTMIAPLRDGSIPLCITSLHRSSTQTIIVDSNSAQDKFVLITNPTAVLWLDRDSYNTAHTAGWYHGGFMMESGDKVLVATETYQFNVARSYGIDPLKVDECWYVSLWLCTDDMNKCRRAENIIASIPNRRLITIFDEGGETIVHLLTAPLQPEYLVDLHDAITQVVWQ